MQAFTHLSNIYPVSGTGDKKMKQSPWPQGINILEQGSANSPLHGQMVNILSHRVCHNSAVIYSTEAAIDNRLINETHCVPMELYGYQNLNFI